MWKASTVLIAGALVVGMAACDDDPAGPDETFVATLSAEGNVESPGTGTATFERNGGVVSFTIDVANMTGVTAAHIHGPANASQNAGVIVGLFAGPQGGTGAVNGRLVTGSFVAADITATAISMDSLLVLMRNGNSYVNVHTVVNPGGEIRGQLQVQ